MSFDVTNSNSIAKFAGLVGVVIASVSIYQEVWLKHNFLMDFFGVSTGTTTSGQYVFTMILVLFVATSWATGKFLQESSLALAGVLLFALFYYGFLSMNKSQKQSEYRYSSAKPVTEYSPHTAREMEDFLIQRGYVRGLPLDADQKQWCNNPKTASGKYTDDPVGRAKALRRCSTGFFWNKA